MFKKIFDEEIKPMLETELNIYYENFKNQGNFNLEFYNFCENFFNYIIAKEEFSVLNSNSEKFNFNLFKLTKDYLYKMISNFFITKLMNIIRRIKDANSNISELNYKFLFKNEEKEILAVIIKDNDKTYTNEKLLQKLQEKQYFPGQDYTQLKIYSFEEVYTNFPLYISIIIKIENNLSFEIIKYSNL